MMELLFALLVVSSIKFIIVRSFYCLEVNVNKPQNIFITKMVLYHVIAYHTFFFPKDEKEAHIAL